MRIQVPSRIRGRTPAFKDLTVHGGVGNSPPGSSFRFELSLNSYNGAMMMGVGGLPEDGEGGLAMGMG